MANFESRPVRRPRPNRSSCAALIRLRHWAAVLLLAAYAPVATSQTAAQDSPSTARWVTTWATSPSSPGLLGQAVPSFENRTLRQIVHTSVGGDRVRVELSNRHGKQTLQIAASRIALRDKASAILTDSDRILTFSGLASVAIPPGALVLSDAVRLAVPPGSDLAISIHIATATTSATLHGLATQTSYISSVGDFTASPEIPDPEIIQSWFFLTAVEVQSETAGGTIVTFGDSITDGYLSTPDTNNRWPDHLARRLAARTGAKAMAIVNAGISGNRILHDFGGFGVNALARFDIDVLHRTGVSHVIILEGINDIGFSAAMRPDEEVTADQIIAGHRQLIERAHAHGLKIYGATLTPFEGAAYFSAEGEQKRRRVNEWIRTSGAYDAVLDFEAATRDPSQPSRFRADFSTDNLHPNDAGYRAMAEAIDLKLFDLE